MEKEPYGNPFCHRLTILWGSTFIYRVCCRFIATVPFSQRSTMHIVFLYISIVLTYKMYCRFIYNTSNPNINAINAKKP